MKSFKSTAWLLPQPVLIIGTYDKEGKPKWYLLEVLKVPSVYRGLRLVYFYDDDREFDVSQELQIEYYD